MTISLDASRLRRRQRRAPLRATETITAEFPAGGTGYSGIGTSRTRTTPISASCRRSKKSPWTADRCPTSSCGRTVSGSWWPKDRRPPTATCGPEPTSTRSATASPGSSIPEPRGGQAVRLGRRRPGRAVGVLLERDRPRLVQRYRARRDLGPIAGARCRGAMCGRPRRGPTVRGVVRRRRHGADPGRRPSSRGPRSRSVPGSRYPPHRAPVCPGRTAGIRSSGRSVPLAVWLLGLSAATGLGAFLFWRTTVEPSPGFPLQYAPPKGLGPVQAEYIRTERVPAQGSRRHCSIWPTGVCSR